MFRDSITEERESEKKKTRVKRRRRKKNLKAHCSALSYYSSLNKLDFIFRNLFKIDTQDVVQTLMNQNLGEMCNNKAQLYMRDLIQKIRRRRNMTLNI